MTKIRLNLRVMEDILSRVQKYDSTFSKEIVCTPIIMKTPIWGDRMYMYQRRICFRIGYYNRYVRFRGKAPIEKAFTLEEFMNSFYAVRDSNEPEKYIFKYYHK